MDLTYTGHEVAQMKILNNVKHLGYTAHLINEKFDLGKVINQIKFKFSGLEYYDEIESKIKKIDNSFVF